MSLYYNYLGECMSYIDKRRVEEQLWPYLKYMYRISEYRQKNAQILDFEPIRDGRSVEGSEVSVLVKTDARETWDDHVRYVYELHDDSGAAGGGMFDPERRIEIKDRDKANRTLRLARLPVTARIVLPPDLNSVRRQIEAFHHLLKRPVKEHAGLLMLLHPQDGMLEWPVVVPEDVDEWFVLTDGDREGADEQRRFVEAALGTPDFAFLEGPPGSGKTTALCELVRQLVSRKKSVLFCASTHVAVDNLLERLMGEDGTPVPDLIPIRVGRSNKMSERAGRYEYDQFVRTKGEDIRTLLALRGVQSRARRLMVEALRGEDTIARLARDCANLVCGTTFGIARYPDIWNEAKRFDYVIIDEASKTTFREFLVPAVHASRWVIVGDTRQLAPHTDQDEIAEGLKECVDPEVGRAYVDAFMARPGNPGRRTTVVVPAGDEDVRDMYRAACSVMETRMCSADGAVDGGGHPCVVVDGPGAIAGMDVSWLPSHGTVVRDYEDIAAYRPANDRQKNAGFWRRAARPGEDHTWEHQMAWRLALRAGGEGRIADEIEMLEPRELVQEHAKMLADVKKMSLPSVLESIQHGFGGGQTVLDSGMDSGAFGDRHVLLTWQHRMHSEIAGFSHRHVYGGEALQTPSSMDAARAWTYGAYGGKRMAWVDVHTGRRAGSAYENTREAERIVEEIDQFAKWAEKNPRPGGGAWEVEVLSFYLDQVFVLGEHLRRYAGSGRMTFQVAGGSVVVGLHTIDSFQGHEADIVFLSMSHWRPTLFVNNPNRLNVALTRARYQCVVVGDRSAMGRADPPLGDLVADLAGAEGAAEAGDPP